MPVLAGLGVSALRSAPAARCLQTLQSYAVRARVLELSHAGDAEGAYALNKAEAVPAFAAVAESFGELFDMKVTIAKTDA